MGNGDHALAVLRARLGVAQERFAALVGLSAGTIAKIEQRKYTPAPWRVACRLAAELGISVEFARALVRGDLPDADVLILAVHVRAMMEQAEMRIGGSCRGKNESDAIEPVSARCAADDAGPGGSASRVDAKRSEPDRARQIA